MFLFFSFIAIVVFVITMYYCCIQQQCLSSQQQWKIVDILAFALLLRLSYLSDCARRRFVCLSVRPAIHSHFHFSSMCNFFLFSTKVAYSDFAKSSWIFFRGCKHVHVCLNMFQIVCFCLNVYFAAATKKLIARTRNFSELPQYFLGYMLLDSLPKEHKGTLTLAHTLTTCSHTLTFLEDIVCCCKETYVLG